MSEFLTEEQLKALEEVIAKARATLGIHRIQASEWEAYAYQLRDEVHWGVNGGPHDTNLAQGTVPLHKPS
jgi:hypothetical protein